MAGSGAIRPHARLRTHERLPAQPENSLAIKDFLARQFFFENEKKRILNMYKFGQIEIESKEFNSVYHVVKDVDVDGEDPDKRGCRRQQAQYSIYRRLRGGTRQDRTRLHKDAENVSVFGRLSLQRELSTEDGL